MRIAVVTWNRRKLGGVETYLDRVISELHGRGQDLALWCEVDLPDVREPILVPAGVPYWCAAQLGAYAAVAQLCRWHPDLIYLHGLHDPRLEEKLLEVAPIVFFMHNHYGTCISGSKTFSFPVTVPCRRQFGPACLAHYFPHRCGGLNPLTMLRMYRENTTRNRLLRQFGQVITHSSYMQGELARHGVRSEKVTFLVHDGKMPEWSAKSADFSTGGWTLLYSGRFDRLKGGQVLLESLPAIWKRLCRPIHVVFAGAGPEQDSWRQLGEHVHHRFPDVSVQWPGWLTGEAYQGILSRCSLAVVPSLIPESFGLIGPEAGVHGVPAAAFDVGGISEWLHEGINGHLAPANPPTAAGLADAVVKCLADPGAYARLCRGARDVASRYSADNHIRDLVAVFEQVAGFAGSRRRPGMDANQ
jgi:glycosyltransferase involved in cell wall biosynthesis